MTPYSAFTTAMAATVINVLNLLRITSPTSLRDMLKNAKWIGVDEALLNIVTILTIKTTATMKFLT